MVRAANHADNHLQQPFEANIRGEAGGEGVGDAAGGDGGAAEAEVQVLDVVAVEHVVDAADQVEVLAEVVVAADIRGVEAGQWVFRRACWWCG